MRGADIPAGFVQFAIGRARVVCTHDVAESIREMLQTGSVFKFAEAHPHARALMGRGAVYAVPLRGNGDRVVVRHNHHGGLLAPLTRDLFRAPTRAPHELHISEELRARGVATPPMLGYVVYDAWLGFKRADVITREIPNSADLSHALMSGNVSRRVAAISAAARLVRTLSAAGAHHADLNVKNILLHSESSGVAEALVLDVDRVTFNAPSAALELNLARLLRSARKWQRIHGAVVTDGELADLSNLARESRDEPARLSTSS